jgi:hypothetical protein
MGDTVTCRGQRNAGHIVEDKDRGGGGRGEGRRGRRGRRGRKA